MLQDDEAELRKTREELATYHDLVTHDVTNFAGTIGLVVERLLTQQDGDIPIRQRDLLRRINRQVYQLNHLAQNAKAIARLSHGALPVPTGTVELRPFLDRVAETVRAAHFDRTVDLAIDCSPELRVKELPLMENVFLNLVDNAVRHTPRDQAPRVKLTASRDNGEVKVSILGGPPAPPEVISKLFSRYVRGSESRGAGLGLTVVREIVERAGGSLEAGTGPLENDQAFEIRMILPDM